MKTVYFILFLIFPNIILAQNNIKINENALKYFNSFLSNKSVIDNVKGKFIFDKYSNELQYKSTRILYKNPYTEEAYNTSIVSFSIPISKIKKIKEEILVNGKRIIMQYKFYLSEKIIKTIEKKTKGKMLDKQKYYVDVVFFPIETEIEIPYQSKIQKVFRDIFINAKIESETQYYN